MKNNILTQIHPKFSVVVTHYATPVNEAEVELLNVQAHGHLSEAVSP